MKSFRSMKSFILLAIAILFALPLQVQATQEVRPLGMDSATGGTSGDIRVGNTCVTSPGGKYYCGFNTRHMLFFTDNTATVDTLYPLAAKTPWRLFYTNGSGDLIAFVFGADNTFLKFTGTSSAPVAATIPTGGTGDYDPDNVAITGGTISVSSLTRGNVSNTEFGYLDGLTNYIQTQLDLLAIGVYTQAYDADLSTLSNLGAAKIPYTDNSSVMQAVTIGAEGTVLTSGGPGNAPTWSAAGAGTPGGSDTQVQFNDGGVFGGSSGMVYNKTTKVLTLDNAISTPGILSTAADNTRFFGKANTGDLDAAYQAAGRFWFNGTTHTPKVRNGDNTATLLLNTSYLTTLPSGAAPTVDAAGEVAVDTTADQLKYYGTAAKVIDPRHTENATFKTPTSGDKAKFRKPYGMTVQTVGCVTDAATSVVLDVQECNANGASCATILSGTITCGTTYGTGTVSDSAIAAGNYVFFSLGTVTGTPGYLYVNFGYIVTGE